MPSRVNRKDKTKGRIRNGSKYEFAVRSRGDVTIWLISERSNISHTVTTTATNFVPSGSPTLPSGQCSKPRLSSVGLTSQDADPTGNPVREPYGAGTVHGDPSHGEFPT